MTLDEVKQLHYKTIIFPIIGYPILSDTVMYNKFSCYQSREKERGPQLLKDLSETYFTVEDLNVEKDSNNKTIEPKEYNEHMKLVKQDKVILKTPVSVTRKELSKNNYGFKYVQTENYRAYALITIESKLSRKDFSVILAKVDKE